LILYQKKNLTNFYKNLYEFLKDAKLYLILLLYIFLQLITSYIPYITFLKINPGIQHFKLSITERDLLASLGNKETIIRSSPLEYEFYTKKLNILLNKFIIQVL
jgi:hypothetical protein